MNGNAILLGDFYPEREWGINDIQFKISPKNAMISPTEGFSALFFVLCSSAKNIVITETKMLKFLIEYLYSLGFKFENYKIDDLTDNLLSRAPKTPREAKILDRILNNDNYIFSPYAVTKKYLLVMNNSKINTTHDINIIKEINSKNFSSYLSRKYTNHKESFFVNTAIDFYEKSSFLLKKYGVILIKENFGVSGRGNTIIKSMKKITRFTNRIKNEEKIGKLLSVVIERFFENIETNFSSHWYISKDGDIKYLGMQIMSNKGFSFNSIFSPSHQIERKIKNTNYFDTIKKMIYEIIGKGYFGYLCFDSAILTNNEIVEVIEINARMSMGLFNLKLSKYLKLFSEFTSIKFVSKRDMNLQVTFNMLKDNEMLFKRNDESGILPVFLQKNCDSYSLYYFIIYNDEQIRIMLKENLFTLIENN